MRQAFVTGRTALRERIENYEQGPPPSAPPAPLPPYMESFLAHLRVLVGVPFEYLVPDERLLAPESIRFFYLDRSWLDRLTDGALAVGKVGTREQAHHQADAAALQGTLDQTERVVRPLQRQKLSFDEAKAETARDERSAQIVTGFVLRSGAVSGWPHMDVRAWDGNDQLKTLRIERLAPSVLIALFEGVPASVWLEEPHHGVQFGVTADADGTLRVTVRRPDGVGLRDQADHLRTRRVPVRQSDKRVIAVAHLRAALHGDWLVESDALPEQNGSAALAIQMLNPPWRQRFEGGEGVPDSSSGGFVHVRNIARGVETIDADEMKRLYAEDG